MKKKIIIISIIIFILIITIFSVIFFKNPYKYIPDIKYIPNVKTKIEYCINCIDPYSPYITKYKESNKTFSPYKLECTIENPVLSDKTYGEISIYNKCKIKNFKKINNFYRHSDFSINNRISFEELKKYNENDELILKIGLVTPLELKDYVMNYYKMFYFENSDLKLISSTIKSSQNDSDIALNIGTINRIKTKNNKILYNTPYINNNTEYDINNLSTVSILELNYIFDVVNSCSNLNFFKTLLKSDIFENTDIDFSLRQQYLNENGINIIGFTVSGKKHNFENLLKDSNLFLVDVK